MSRNVMCNRHKLLDLIFRVCIIGELLWTGKARNWLISYEASNKVSSIFSNGDFISTLSCITNTTGWIYFFILSTFYLIHAEKYCTKIKSSLLLKIYWISHVLHYEASMHFLRVQNMFYIASLWDTDVIRVSFLNTLFFLFSATSGVQKHRKEGSSPSVRLPT
jgi:hypothetical protein